MRALIFIAAVACAPAAAQAPDAAPADTSEAWNRGLREQAERALRRLMPVPSFTDSLRAPAVKPGDPARRWLAPDVYAADPDRMPVWAPDARLDSAMVHRPPQPVPYMPGAESAYRVPDSLQIVPDSLGGQGWMKKRNE